MYNMLSFVQFVEVGSVMVTYDYERAYQSVKKPEFLKPYSGVMLPFPIVFRDKKSVFCRFNNMTWGEAPSSFILKEKTDRIGEDMKKEFGHIKGFSFNCWVDDCYCCYA